MNIKQFFIFVFETYLWELKLESTWSIQVFWWGGRDTAVHNVDVFLVQEIYEKPSVPPILSQEIHHLSGQLQQSRTSYS